MQPEEIRKIKLDLPWMLERKEQLKRMIPVLQENISFIVDAMLDEATSNHDYGVITTQGCYELFIDKLRETEWLINYYDKRISSLVKYKEVYA